MRVLEHRADLPRCPQCKTGALPLLVVYEVGDSTAYFVQCSKCTASGSGGMCRQDAVERWIEFCAGGAELVYIREQIAAIRTACDRLEACLNRR